MSDKGYQRISTATRGAPGACAVLVLLALAWTQLALASHLLDHPATAVDDACSVCLQFDRVGDADLDSGTAEAAAAPAATLATRTTQGRSVAHSLPARQRAPPIA